VASNRVTDRLQLPMCPYLKGSHGTVRAYASNRNVCTAEAEPGVERDFERVEIDHQTRFCLTKRYVECPRYVAAAGEKSSGV
jgi:hypothetical protein